MELYILAQQIGNFIETDYAFEERIVYAINDDKLQHCIVNLGELQKAMAADCTIKVQSLEKLNPTIWGLCETFRLIYKHHGPITCHAFIAQAGSPTFAHHTDPDDVHLLVLNGTKRIEMISGKTHILNSGNMLFIKAGTSHCAINDAGSIMLSFGIEKFMEDKV